MLIETPALTFALLPPPLEISVIYALLAVFFLIYPLYNAWEMRRYREREPRLTAAEASAERLHDYRKAILILWSTSAVISFLLFRGQFAAEELWLIPRFDALSLLATGIALLACVAMALQTRGYKSNEELRAKTLPKLAHIEPILPRTRGELRWFYGLSLTAGITEEFIFRGFLIALLTPPLGLWGAMLVSSAAFGFAHIYQGGVAGFLRTAFLGSILMAIVYFSGSIWPAVILHAVIDMVGGYIAYYCMKDGTPAAPPSTAEPAPSVA